MSNHFLRQVTAGLAVMAIAEAKAVVTFEFKDVGAGTGHEVSVNPGDPFSFEVWLHASTGTQVNGVSFKLRFLEYNPVTGDTFTITGEPSRTGSAFTFVTAPGPVSGERLEGNNPSDLGSFLASVLDSRDGDQYIATITLTVDAGMPNGTYEIQPNGAGFEWTETGDGGFPFDAWTPYSVHVVPEPGACAIAGGLGLLGFAAYRRWTTSRR